MLRPAIATRPMPKRSSQSAELRPPQRPVERMPTDQYDARAGADIVAGELHPLQTVASRTKGVEVTPTWYWRAPATVR
jgi:hypothetical protein